MGGICAIIGFGPGLATAYAETFAEAGYKLALISRSGRAPDGPTGDAGMKSYACDAGDPAALTNTLGEIEQSQGPVDVLIYNADVKRFGPIDEISTEDFELSWRASVLGLFASAKALAPGTR